VTCEEVVKLSGKKHGYCFEIPSSARGPVQAVPIPAAGRFAHEAVAYLDGILYETEDRSLSQGGAVFYRYIAEGSDQRRGAIGQKGRLEALKVRGEPQAAMDSGRTVGRPYPVEWVLVPEPDHEDHTDMLTDRQPGLTPTRYQAQDNGAAIFDRTEGAWIGGDRYHDGRWKRGKVYFDCTTGGPQDLGQVWEYDPRRMTITLLYESSDAARLENPDNVVVVPETGDILLQEDGGGAQFIRGLTQRGQIYDFAHTVTNDTEFCGGCFDPRREILYVNQQGDRGSLPDGPADARAVTYAIFGPFTRDHGHGHHGGNGHGGRGHDDD
jgi:secreted PhoX family phosphatase